MPVDELIKVLDGLELGAREQKIVGVALIEVKKRLAFLNDVGAGYLSLSRRADTLSGGESQRIRLRVADRLAAHGRPIRARRADDRAASARYEQGCSTRCRAIRDIGNTVLVVEHDRDTMAAADHILELGPGAGERGGELIANGSAEEIMEGNSSTALYLRGEADGDLHSAHENGASPRRSSRYAARAKTTSKSST